MKQLLILFALVAFVAFLAPAQQLEKPVVRNYVTAAAPTAPYDSISVSQDTTVSKPKQLLSKMVMFSAKNWNGTDTLNIVLSTSDTSSVTRMIQLGPGVSYVTPHAIPLICIKVRGTAAGVKYSLIVQ